MRVILYTGKGGVGKTTISAATALRCASLGYKTLVISTDAAHSLGDSLDMPVSDQPTPVAPNLWAQEVNALHELEDHWEQIHIYFAALFAAQDGIDEIVAEEMATPPGMEEVAALMVIKQHKQDAKFDVLVVDCAPTGETLQLLAFPDVAKWYLDKIFPLQRTMTRVARPLIQPFIKIPLPEDSLFGHIKELFTDLEAMKLILGDPKTCTTRIVLNLEKMVIKEAQRAFTYLSLYDYLTDLIIVNRFLPSEVTSPYFAHHKASQSRYGAEIENAFAPLPILRNKLFDHEIFGLEALAEIGQALFGETDPTTIFYATIPQQIKRQGSTYELRLHLPFVTKEEVILTHRTSELFVSVGPYKREIALPKILQSKSLVTGRLADGLLTVAFS